MTPLPKVPPIVPGRSPHLRPRAPPLPSSFKDGHQWRQNSVKTAQGVAGHSGIDGAAYIAIAAALGAMTSPVHGFQTTGSGERRLLDGSSPCSPPSSPPYHPNSHCSSPALRVPTNVPTVHHQNATLFSVLCCCRGLHRRPLSAHIGLEPRGSLFSFFRRSSWNYFATDTTSTRR